MKRSVLALAILITSFTQAQDLTGTWEGYGSFGGATYLKLVLIKCNDQWVGYSYDSGPGYCQANFAGYFDESSMRLRGEGKGMIRKTLEHTQSSFNLTYKKFGGVEYLEGPVRPKSTMFQILTFGIGPRTRIRKISNTVDTTEFMRACINSDPPAVIPPIVRVEPKLDSMSVKRDTIIAVPAPVIVTPPPIAEIKQARQNDTVATVVTKEKTITITMYDNGQIDGDTITVFHNNMVIADRLGVSATPYKFTIHIDKDHPSHEIVFVANNLGSIPPNTAVLIIETGDKKYNLFASSDLKRNSVVIFRFEE